MNASDPRADGPDPRRSLSLLPLQDADDNWPRVQFLVLGMLGVAVLGIVRRRAARLAPRGRLRPLRGVSPAGGRPLDRRAGRGRSRRHAPVRPMFMGRSTRRAVDCHPQIMRPWLVPVSPANGTSGRCRRRPGSLPDVPAMELVTATPATAAAWTPLVLFAATRTIPRVAAIFIATVIGLVGMLHLATDVRRDETPTPSTRRDPSNLRGGRCFGHALTEGGMDARPVMGALSDRGGSDSTLEKRHPMATKKKATQGRPGEDRRRGHRRHRSGDRRRCQGDRPRSAT